MTLPSDGPSIFFGNAVLRRYALLLALVCLATACASVPPQVETQAPQDDFMAELEAEFSDEFEEEEQIADPLKAWNVVWFTFNDKVYFWLLKPTSTAYGWVMPRFARIGVRNFFDNLDFPMHFFNLAFQGRVVDSGGSLGRFCVNTTVGVAGVWDPATRWLHIPEYDEDFDQTLAVWGVGTGPFLTWPMVGPCSARGTFGFVLDTAMNPTTYLTYFAPGASTVDRVNDVSLGEDPYETIVDMALDPYTGVRDAYIQNRIEEISK